nr:hypothetical protein [Paracoccus versutus]
MSETRELSYSQAIQEAIAIAMEADPRVFLMGEDVGVYGGAFQVTGDLVHRFGEDRIIDTPISELGGAGVAVGAALTGMRPIFEFQFFRFRDAGDGADRKPSRQAALHAGRRGFGPAGDALSQRLGYRRSGATFAEP